MPVEMSREEYDQKKARAAELRALLQRQLAQAKQAGVTQQQMDATHFADPFDPTAHRLREGDLRKLKETVNSGVFLGGGDELASGLTAAASAPFMDATFSEIYDKEQSKHEREQADLAERNPSATLAARVAGGVAGTGARIGLMLPVAKVLGKVPGGAFAGGPLRETIAKTVGAGVEGAATGYLTADREQNREQAAAIGAPLQSSLYAAIKALGRSGRGVVNVGTNNRYSLGPDEDFVPLNMVGEGTLPSAYRKMVGTSFGGGPEINEQSAKVLQKALNIEDNAKTALGATQDQARRNFTYAKNEITDSALIAKNLAEQQGLSQTQAARLAAQQIEEQTNQAFRSTVINRSLPEATPAQLRQEIVGMTPVQANNALDDLWGQHGFADIKQRAFVVRPEELHNAVREALDNPGQDALVSGIRAQIDKMFTRHGDAVTVPPTTAYKSNPLTGAPIKNPRVPSGELTIQGDALMQIRNDLRTAASNLPEHGFGATEANALRKAAHAVDAQIERQLDPAAQAKYRLELDAYGHRRTLDKTIQATPNDLFGQFQPKHWLIGAERYSPRRLARGEAPTQSEAEEAIKVAQAAKRELGEKEENARLFVQTTKNKVAADKLKEKRELIPPKETPEVQQAAQVLKQASEQAAILARRMPTQDPAYWTRNYNTDLLTRPFGLPTQGTATTAAGTAIGGLLANKTTQRLLAGDTQTQRSIADWLRNAYDPKYKGPVHRAGQALLRSVTPEATQMFTPTEEY